jgi:cAMP-specific phosphodiesterase 4
MQEDISYSSLFSVLKFMVKILVDADEFTFFIRRETEWEVLNV